MDLRFASLLVGVILSTLDYSILTVALPDLSQSFRVTASEVQGATSLYLLGSAVTFIPLSSCANLWGTGRVFRSSLLAFSLFSLVLALTQRFDALLLLRFLQGVAGAGIVGLVPGLAAATFPERRGWALSLVISASAAGTLLGPPIGGIIVEYWGWQSVFLLNLPLGILAFALSNNLPNLAEVKLRVGLRQLLRVPRFFLALLASVFFFAHTFGTVLILPFYLQSQGFTPSKVGLLLLFPSLITLLLGCRAGLLSDQLGFAKVTLFGAIVLAVSSWVQGITSQIGIGILGLGLGRCLFQAANSAAVLSLAPKGVESLASCFLSISRVLGQALGSLIAGWIWTTFAFQGYGFAFMSANLVLGILALIAGTLVYLRKSQV
ncbi:MAG: MFS transporter [Chroococcidiopsidaceae cyanobacterium CP_BM_RX_35]|nr:MFS transporter [Chroococcidiopsidaceae cyanobacterium CP_BM_RX_35]